MEEKLKELMFLWKGNPKKQRCTVLFAISFFGFFSIYSYRDVVSVESELESSKERILTLDMKLRKAQKLKEDTPELENLVEYTKKQLSEAKKSLPDRIKMGDFLEIVAKSAKDSDVDLLLFKPSEEKVKQEGYNYIESYINIEVEGSYNKVGHFFDQIVHMRSMVHIRDMKIDQIKSVQTDVTVETTKEAKLMNELSAIKIKAAASLVLFKSQSAG